MGILTVMTSVLPQQANKHLYDVLQIITNAAQLYPDSRNLARHQAELLAKCGREREALEACEAFLFKFGVDDDLLSMALLMRQHIGVYDHLEEAGADSISLCMIVKNEEMNLPACLASLKPIIHEMVVIDTGSSDRTADIAAAFGSRVFNFAWNGNFSDARNCAVNEARGKWILVMDADEVLAANDYEAVRSAVREAGDKKIAWSVLTRNYTTQVNAQGWIANDGAYPREERADGWHPSWKVRLFQNQPGIKFSGEVHEMVESSLRQSGFTTRKASFVAHHYGELASDGKDLEKQLRYFETGMKKLEQNPDDLAAIAELAVQAGELGRFEEAISLWDRVLARMPDVVEALFNKGYCLMGLKRYDEALVVSRRALELDPAHKEAAFNYGTCELYVGDLKRALNIVRPLAEKNRDYPLLQALLVVLLLGCGLNNEAGAIIAALKTGNYAIKGYIMDRAAALEKLGRNELGYKILSGNEDAS